MPVRIEQLCRKRTPSFSLFFHDRGLRHLARSYLGDRARAIRRAIELHVEDPEAIASSQPLLATPRERRLNFLLFLNDVGGNNESLFGPGCNRASTLRNVPNAPGRTWTERVPTAVGPFANMPEQPAWTCDGPEGSLIIWDYGLVGPITPGSSDARTVLVDSWEVDLHNEV